MSYTDIQQFLEEVAVEAAQKFITPQFIQRLKEDHTPVTDIDESINQFVVRRIVTEYPDIPIVSEEMNTVRNQNTNDHCFFIDPIDGTRALIEGKGIDDVSKFFQFIQQNSFTLDSIIHEQVLRKGFSVEGVQSYLKMRSFHATESQAQEEFAHSIQEYATLLGLSRREKSVVGVCYIPKTKELYAANEGNGAFKSIGTNRIRLPSSNNPGIVIGRYSVDKNVEQELEKRGHSLETVSYGGSFGVKAVWVAEGRVQQFIHTNFDETKVHASKWDSCAVDCIVQESGGRTTDLDGNPIDYSAQNIAITRGYVASR